MDREAVRVIAAQTGRPIDIDLATAEGKSPLREAVRPWMQQRDPHRSVLTHVLLDPSPLAEQLLAAVPQRAADHARVRYERRVKLRWRAQHDRIAARDHAPVNLVSGSSLCQ